jgi:hypothetical protein
VTMADIKATEAVAARKGKKKSKEVSDEMVE